MTVMLPKGVLRGEAGDITSVSLALVEPGYRAPRRLFPFNCVAKMPEERLVVMVAFNGADRYGTFYSAGKRVADAVLEAV
jgi:hypothetical protein